jgi:hypothetical protein
MRVTKATGTQTGAELVYVSGFTRQVYEVYLIIYCIS